jgi:hypothetical protein
MIQYVIATQIRPIRLGWNILRFPIASDSRTSAEEVGSLIMIYFILNRWVLDDLAYTILVNS